jgi:hypothetical protein
MFQTHAYRSYNSRLIRCILSTQIDISVEPFLPCNALPHVPIYLSFGIGPLAVEGERQDPFARKLQKEPAHSDGRRGNDGELRDDGIDRNGWSK